MEIITCLFHPTSFIRIIIKSIVKLQILTQKSHLDFNDFQKNKIHFFTYLHKKYLLCLATSLVNLVNKHSEFIFSQAYYVN